MLVMSLARVIDMARETFQMIMDDFDGTAPAGGHTFSLDGESYSIDLSEENHERLREALQPFIAVAKRGTQANKITTREARAHRKVIRAWAAQNGYEVSERGAIPNEVQEAFAKSLLGKGGEDGPVRAKRSRGKRVESEGEPEPPIE